MSAFCTAWMNISPMPGHWNTVSVMMAKAMMAPSCRPITVITGHQRVLQRMAEIDGALGQPARAGELDVVGAQHLQHLGAHQARHQRHLEQAERDRRQDQRLEAGGRQQAGAPEADAHHLAAAERRQHAEHTAKT